MCVSPVLIPNPNYHNTTELIRLTTDTENQFIRVPCNHCPECLAARQSAIVQRVRCLSLDHYIFFCTLTYNKESLPWHTCSNGFKIPYADISDAQKMFKRIRSGNLFGVPFRYFFISERGKQKARPHFHGLFFIKKNPNDDSLITAQLETRIRKVLFSEWKRNYGSDRVPDWRPLFTFRQKYVASRRFSNFDCHYVVPHSTEHGSDDVAFYVTKYLLKPSPKENALQQALRMNLDPSEYDEVWRLVRSRSFSSKGFGAFTDTEINHVRFCIDKSSNDPDGLKYYNSDGSSFPLARYYRRFLSAENAIKSVAARGGPLSVDDRDLRDKLDAVENGNRIRAQVSKRDLSEFFTDDNYED